VVEEEESGSWLKDILCWEAWNGGDGLPEPRGREVDTESLIKIKMTTRKCWYRQDTSWKYLV
jgi:hypothetical protein